MYEYVQNEIILSDELLQSTHEMHSYVMIIYFL